MDPRTQKPATSAGKQGETPHRLVDQHLARRFGKTGNPSGAPQASGAASRAWRKARPYLWRGQVRPAFWTIASTFSLVVNIILIVVLIFLGRELFFLKQVVSDQLIGGLYDNFLLMDQASIVTNIPVSETIQVNDTIRVKFDLPLEQDTEVTLTSDTPVQGATIYLNNQPVPLNLVLRKGTVLGIHLGMSVPVDQMVPVSLKVPVKINVPVNIPLSQTDLHKPFTGLKQVVSPYRDLLGGLPNSWKELCKGASSWLCRWLRLTP